MEEVWAAADMIVKVKEPLPAEYNYFKPQQALYTYFIWPRTGNRPRALIRGKYLAIAYETVELDNGELPLLTPISEVAGECRFR